MVSGTRASVVATIATVAFVAMIAMPCASAATKTKAKPPRPGEGLAPIELSIDPAPARSAAALSSGPARFFSINQVLAKRDRRAPGDGLRMASFDPTTSATDAPAAGVPLMGGGPEPFGLYAFQAPEGLLWLKWRKLQRDMQGEADALAACGADAEACSAAALRFQTLVGAALAKHGRDRLAAVSHAVNALVRYTSDYAQFGVADRWSAPLATLTTRRGDCEDYAILKYGVLRAAGVAAADLRLVLLRDRLSGQDHAILAAREGSRWYLLDNLGHGFYADNERPNYMPLFALDDKGVKLFAAPYAKLIHHESEMMPAVAENAAGAGGAQPTTPYLL